MIKRKVTYGDVYGLGLFFSNAKISDSEVNLCILKNRQSIHDLCIEISKKEIELDIRGIKETLQNKVLELRKEYFEFDSDGNPIIEDGKFKTLEGQTQEMYLEAANSFSEACRTENADRVSSFNEYLAQVVEIEVDMLDRRKMRLFTGQELAVLAPICPEKMNKSHLPKEMTIEQLQALIRYVNII